MQSNVEGRNSLMRVKEVARMLDQHPVTIYRKVHAGELPAIRLGSGRAAIRVPRAKLLAWLSREEER